MEIREFVSEESMKSFFDESLMNLGFLFVPKSRLDCLRRTWYILRLFGLSFLGRRVVFDGFVMSRVSLAFNTSFPHRLRVFVCLYFI